MALATLGLLGLGWLATVGDVVDLREVARTDQASHVVIDVSAHGENRSPNSKGKGSTAVPIEVTSRIEYDERIRSVGPSGSPLAAIRYVRQASAAITSAERPLRTTLRPELARLVAERADEAVRVYSSGGPLTREELDLLEEPLDPLVFGDFLPRKKVAAGDTWELGDAVARAISGYQPLATNSLRARLETLDAQTAVIHVAGTVRGLFRGSEATVELDGTLRFDLGSNRITRAEFTRTETHKAGPVEPDSEFKGKVTVTRAPIAVPAELTEAASSAVPAEPPSGLLLLEFAHPEGLYRLYHDRGWHLYWIDNRTARLELLDRGEMLAQCNLQLGPRVAPGRHQDIEQLRSDIRAALGKGFGAFLSADELDPNQPGGFHCRVAVRSTEHNEDVLRLYHWLASAEGQQVLAIFTLKAADARRFSDRDLPMMGTFEWPRTQSESRPKAAASPSSETKP